MVWMFSGGCQGAWGRCDRIWVRVSWDQDFVSPVANVLGFDTITVDGESAMAIIGAPVAGSGASPPPCDVTGVSVTPNPVIRTAGGELQNDLTIDVAGSGSCSNLTVTLVQGGLSEVASTGPSCLGTTVFAADQTNAWSTGLASVEVTGDDTATGSFTVIDLNPCDVTGVTVTPASVERHQSGANADELAENLSVAVNRTGVCTDLTVTLIPPGGATSKTLCQTELHIGSYSAAGDKIWTQPGQATIQVTGEDTGTGQFTVTNEPASCSVTVSVADDPVQATSNRKDLQSPSAVSITVTPTGALQQRHR